MIHPSLEAELMSVTTLDIELRVATVQVAVHIEKHPMQVFMYGRVSSQPYEGGGVYKGMTSLLFIAQNDGRILSSSCNNIIAC